MATPRTQLQLLVTEEVSGDHREILVAQVRRLHPGNKSEIAVMIWDEEKPPHFGMNDQIRRYAAPEVCTAVCKRGDRAVREWQQKWRTVDTHRVNKSIRGAGMRWLPMYVCLEGTRIEPNIAL